jgi:tetratricopeptide (TPR) repeat protein
MVEFMPGAFAYHLHSFSAATLRSTKRQWVGPLLEKGATATMGFVAEPFLGGTPNIATFFERFTFSGFTFGEAAYASQYCVSWQTTVVGDPLYRPFGRSAAELNDDLQRRHSPLLEWSYLRALNVDLIMGAPLEQMVSALENLPLTKDSAVLQEKLAELFTEQGKPSSSVFALQKVLQLKPTPQQRVRVMLGLASRLVALGREPEAYSVYQQFVAQCPDYPDVLAIYQKLEDLAQKLGKRSDIAKYQRKINQINSPHTQSEKWPWPGR